MKSASASSTSSTSSIAPDGSPRHVNVGGLPAPSQVSAAGIAPPSLKSGVEKSIVSAAAGSGAGSSSPPQPARAAATNARG